MSFLKRLFGQNNQDDTISLYTPPKRTSYGSFRMMLEDVFTIKGRGPVITGRVASGTLQKGDTIVIEGDERTITAQVAAIEMFRKTVTTAQEGDNVGVLLSKEVKYDQLKRGMIVTKQGE